MADEETGGYKPRAGSGAAKAIAYLTSLEPGTMVETAALAIAADMPANGVMSVLGPSVRAGLLKIHRVKKGANGARTNAYSAPVGDAFDQDEARGGKPVQRIVGAGETTAPRAGVASVFDLAAKMPPGALPFDLASDDTPTPPPTAPGLNWKPGKPLQPALVDAPATPPTSTPATATPPAANPAPITTAPDAQQPAPAPLDCALWSNGELWLRIDGREPLVLCKAQTKTLIHYLDRLVVELSPTTT